MRGALSAVSRMALEMKAVSPLRRASTIRNFLTDDSSEIPLSVLGDLPPANEGVFEGVRPIALPATESLELWPLGCWWCVVGIAGSEDVAAVEVAEVVLPKPSPIDAASSVEDMSSSAPFRLNKERAEDLVRRCELRVERSVSGDTRQHPTATRDRQ